MQSGSLGATGSTAGNCGYVTQRELKLPTRMSLLNAASHPTGMLAGFLLCSLSMPWRKPVKRSPFRALLLIVRPNGATEVLEEAMTLADDVPGPIGRQAKARAMRALPISHAPIAPLRRLCERGIDGDRAADRFAGMAGTWDAC
jgi:hypothetical protein